MTDTQADLVERLRAVRGAQADGKLPTLIAWMREAADELERLRASNKRLLTMLNWCIEHDGECLGDHPSVLARMKDARRAALKDAQGDKT